MSRRTLLGVVGLWYGLSECERYGNWVGGGKKFVAQL